MKNYIKKHKIIYILLKHMFFFLWAKYAFLKFYIKYLFIKLKIIKEDERFNNVKKLKNKFKNKRCFIVATGPSLTLEDLSLLQGEITISMNSIINILDKTKYRPDFYMVQDRRVFEKINKNDHINRLNPECIYFAISNIGNGAFFEKDIKYKNCNFFHLDTASIWYDLYCGKFKTYFSDNCSFRIIDGTTITYTAIQFATYLGFKEIYLIGTDCNYTGKKRHIIDYDSLNEINNLDEIYRNMITAYKKAKEVTEKQGVKIYNATRGGNLEVFERVNLDDILKK